MLTRHTIAAAGIVLGYLFVSFVLNILMSSIESLQEIKRWLPENNVLAFLNHGQKYQVYTTTITDQGSQQDYVERTISFAASAGYWSVIVVVLVGVTFLLFRRRDVN
jgi:ABC-type transport system involved in multi-copper enzyme maturation permease subunit